MVWAACPNCGWRQECDRHGTALLAANAHNAGCRKQKERIGVAEEPARRPRRLDRPDRYIDRFDYEEGLY